MSSRRKDGAHLLTRREILRSVALVPAALRAAPLFAGPLLSSFANAGLERKSSIPFADLRLTPRYPVKSPLADVIALVTPGSDGYITEKYADEIGSVLKKWSDALKASPAALSVLAESLDESIEASTLAPTAETVLRSICGISTIRRQFTPDLARGRDRFIENLRGWLATPLQIETAEFEIFGIELIANGPLVVRTDIRYDVVSDRAWRAQRRARRLVAC